MEESMLSFFLSDLKLRLPNVFTAVGAVKNANSPFLFGYEKNIVFAILGPKLSILIFDEISQLPLGYLLLLVTHDWSYEQTIKENCKYVPLSFNNFERF
jgi:hypothetical protein